MNWELLIDEILKDPTVKGHRVTFRTGERIFTEGEDSRDLYVLISGKIDILKGGKKISEYVHQGDVFGEVSYFLRIKRTATAVASDDATLFCIPSEDVSECFEQYPGVSLKISTTLSKRLAEVSDIMIGLDQFADQYPEAVTLADREGKILMCNRVAQDLYGRDRETLLKSHFDDIYEEPAAYKQCLKGVNCGGVVGECVLKMRHPEKGIRYISTRTTLIHDGQRLRQGALSFGRDVTKTEKMRQRYRSVKRWIIPVFILAVLFIVTSFFLGHFFSKEAQLTDFYKQKFQDQLFRDSIMLKSLLQKPFFQGDRVETGRIMKNFIESGKVSGSPYEGLILLDREKSVYNAFSLKEGLSSSSIIGTSYKGIDFERDRSETHIVLTLYRSTRQHPMGIKSNELAFEMSTDNQNKGWLVFQLDRTSLKNEYHVDEAFLKNLSFPNR